MNTRNLWMLLILTAGISLLIRCGGQESAHEDTIQIAANTSTPITQEDQTFNADSQVEPVAKDPELIAEDVVAEEVQTAVADISLDELKNAISLRHNKPLFLNFWATWCGPCIEEMPTIVDLHKKYGKQVDFLSISCDHFTDTVDQVSNAIQTLKMAFKTRVLKVDDQNQAIAAIDSKWPGSLPATFIYNTQGEKITMFLGSQTKETFEAAMEEALKSVVKVKLE